MIKENRRYDYVRVCISCAKLTCDIVFYEQTDSDESPRPQSALGGTDEQIGRASCRERV